MNDRVLKFERMSIALGTMPEKRSHTFQRATIPETLPARDLLQGLARAVHEESCGVISELHSLEQRQLNEPFRV